MSEWRPIESAPRDGTLKLFVSANGAIFIAPDVEEKPLSRAQEVQLAKDGHWPDHRAWKVTHWMPLPEPPK